ncbi:bifunctional phosphoribosylaminoimidazolecarboxamide formyltransferase/IMP cyclohydrolase [Flexithrix dorotheae]|uniref:bifunctional phosphoribosylaminoimidazolecarboxamide formyltransferase/IMP cyclohydrolase n=1 Tax=Flexithrix dorotheae TaxID=70993 RepID=UPI00036BAFEA|nr:bifunctional phosphoribosylaminoimidazolecarboxamide formyltransferase/IMP cyclohydrolase [Flexithrix dorotheae]
MKKIQSALISVFYKDNLEPIVKLLHENGVKLYSTGGTQKFIEDLSIPVEAVENVTGYPSILGGRVKTLHPKVFGGILYRRDEENDQKHVEEYVIPAFDLVIVDLYPFEETVASDAAHQDIIEKIDIGGISLIRAAAKNYKDVLIVSSREQYGEVETLLNEKNCATELEDRKLFAAKAFDISSHYDSAIFNYFNSELPEEQNILNYKESIRNGKVLRYGENPHQKGVFYGNLDDLFEQLNGKALSYNNLVDIDAAVLLMDEFPAGKEVTYAILKHNNACGLATAETSVDAYKNALKADPVSAFGGVIITNTKVDLATAEELHKLFFEVLIAPSYDEEALTLLKGKKNRILLIQKETEMPKVLYKTLLNGVIAQDKDLKTETEEDLKTVTKRQPSAEEIKSLLFANKLVKHAKSNTIVLAKDGQLFASGVGQTSRVDSLRQAIHKAKSFGFDLKEAVMASDAFFPFPDCVEIANEEGIKAVIQPGGSIRDKDSIEFCDNNGVAMVMTGVRHFKH